MPTPVPELEGQAVQAADDAAVALKVPAAHAVTLPTTPVNPASARQSVRSSEPSALPLFGGQASQVSAVWALAALNLEAAQRVQEAAPVLMLY